MTSNTKEWGYIKSNGEKKFYFFLSESEGRYLSALQRHGRAELTITTYRSNINGLIPIIGELKGKDAKLSDLDEEDYFAILSELTGSESTRGFKMWILREWVEFETGADPFSKVKLLWNATEPDRTFITREEFDRVYQCARNDCERLLMMLGSQMGLRMAEIIGIRLGDMNNGFLTIRGKGHNGGKVVRKRIPVNLQGQIESYILGERAEVADGSTDILLLSNVPHHPKGRPLTRHSVVNVYARISKSSGIHVTSHVMRRLYCTILADEAGLRGDLDTLRRMMRHEDVGTTIRCYLDANAERIAQAEGVIEDIFSSGS